MGQESIISDRLLRPQEAADLLGVSVRTLADWRWKSIGPRYCRIQGRPRYRVSQLDEWVTEREVGTEAQ